MKNAMAACSTDDYAFNARLKQIIKMICNGDDRACRETIGRMYSLEDLGTMAVTIEELEKF